MPLKHVLISDLYFYIFHILCGIFCFIFALKLKKNTISEFYVKKINKSIKNNVINFNIIF